MIEFSGELTGITKRYYIKRNISFWRKFTLFGSLVVNIPLMIFSIVKHISILFYISCVVVILAYFSPCLIKIMSGVIPKKVFIDGEMIVSISDSQTESQYIEDVKEIYDYGDFYSFMFVSGQYTPHFVCQKDLISKGTLEDFEMLFSDKIIRKR